MTRPEALKRLHTMIDILTAQEFAFGDVEKCYDTVECLRMCETALRNKPEAHWNPCYEIGEGKYECSSCSMTSDDMSEYCPNCGAEMVY